MALCTHQSLVGLSSLFGFSKLEPQPRNHLLTPLILHGNRRSSLLVNALLSVRENSNLPKASTRFNFFFFLIFGFFAHMGLCYLGNFEMGW